MCCVMFIQVFLRVVLNSGVVWAEIYARYSIIWAVMLYANVLIKNDKLTKADFLDDFWPISMKRYRDNVYKVIVIVILLLLTYYGWINSVGGLRAMIPAVKVRYFWIYLSIPVGSILMLFQYLYLLAADLMRVSME